MRALPDIVRGASRYAIAGAIVAATYIGLTLLLDGPVGLALQAAIPVGYVLAVSLHFILQRFFVFADADAFALTGAQQVRRYLVIGAVQYAITALATATLPELLGVDERVIYVAVVVFISACTFLMLRTRVFHAAP